MVVNFPSEDEIIDMSHSLDELESCLYFLIDDGEVVYVGQSTNVIWRLRSHIIDPEKKFDSYTLVSFPLSMLNEVEAKYIVELRPKYNK